MPCFICKGRSQFYQRLDRSRMRFIRKVYPDFNESSYLCVRCFEKFEKIFKSKKKTKINSSTISVDSNASLKTVSSKSSEKNSKDSTTERRYISSKENTQSNGSPPLRFLSNSLTGDSEDSMDSTDRLVYMNKEVPSLQDSSRVSRNADVVIARKGAEAAERSALRRKRMREVDTPETPAGRKTVDTDSDDDTSEIGSDVVLADLLTVGPKVKRRKEAVVHLNKDVMDIYLANTSGG